MISIESPYATSYYDMSHPLAGLWATYDVHLGLIGKRVVDFLN